MKNLLILALAMCSIMACSPKKNAEHQNTKCQAECPNGGQCGKHEGCTGKHEGCAGDHAGCKHHEGCKHQGKGNGQCTGNHANCPHKKDGQAQASKFIAENCPAKPVSLKGYSKGLQHIGLPTAEVQKTIDFYTGLGFTLATRHDINGQDFAFVKFGDLLIEIIPNDKPTMRAGAVDHICLDVTNIEELYKKIKDAGYKMIDDHIVDIAFWQKGARYFFIEGPNKERIEFCEIVK